MDALSMLTLGFICLGCFIVGAKVGQAVSKGETIETPSINPIKAIREHEVKKEAQAEQKKMEAIMRNIERYDGTPNGQENVPQY